MKYTKSAFLDTFDFIKTFIYVFEVLIQLGYIGYLFYRIVSNTGIFISNIILIVISFGYFVYHIATTREFYTHEQKENKKIAKFVVKILKRVVNAVVVGLSIYQLILNPTDNGIKVLVTLVMILGYVLSIMGDIITKVINDKAMIIINAIKYDLDNFRENHLIKTEIANFFTKMIKIDIKSLPLEVEYSMIEKVKKVNHRQELKNRRMRDFKKKKL